MYLVFVIIILTYVPICDVIPDVILALPEPAGGLRVQRPGGGVRHPSGGHEPCLHPDILKTIIINSLLTMILLMPKSNPSRIWTEAGGWSRSK